MTGLVRMTVSLLALLAAPAPSAAPAAPAADSAGLAALRVAAPTTAAAALGEIADVYRQRTGRAVEIVADATETLTRRIEGGEAFDLFFASDAGAPATLVHRGLAVAGSRTRFARGVLVLWSPTAGRDLRGPDALHHLGDHRLAIADPALSPYGEAAIQTLQSLGLEQRLRPRLARAASAAAAMQLVRSGRAELAFVALAQVRALPEAKRGSLWIVPEPLHRPIVHEAVMLTASRDTAAARAFLMFATRRPGRAILARYGFDPHGVSAPP